jgi:class 3 adenylate cyclase
VKFRAKIFLAIILPSSALVVAAVAAALAGITSKYEESAQDQLQRTRIAFERTLAEQLNQLTALTQSFKLPRFDAAISEAVASGDLKTARQRLEYQFQLVGGIPDFFELRGNDGKVLIRKSLDGAGTPGPAQSWREPEKGALTAFDGQPFLAVRFEHERGVLVVGKHVKATLDNLQEGFGIHLALVGGTTTVYSSKEGWTPSIGMEGTIFVGSTRYLATRGAPPFSELGFVVLMADMGKVDDARRAALFLGLCGLAVAVLVASLVSSIVSRGVSTPVEKLVDAARKIAAGDYNVKVDVARADEIGRLAGAFNEMTDGLRKRQEIMDKTLSRDVAEEFLKGTDRRPDRRIVTIVFMDIRGYTSGTEGMDPGDVVVMLNELMDLLSGAIVRNGGIVNKFLGDGLMAMFGAPKPLEGHALKAVRAGLEMQKWMERWNDRRLARNLPSFYSGIGINTGVAMCGKVGAQDRMEYTLIGEEVNLASRICGKAAPKQVLVTKQTWDMVKDQIKGRELEPVVVKGLSYPIKVFEVLE